MPKLIGECLLRGGHFPDFAKTRTTKNFMAGRFFLLFNRKKVFTVLLNSVFISALCFAQSDKSHGTSEQPFACVACLKGKVEYKPNEKGDWQEASAGMALAPENILKTGAGGYASLVFFDGSKASLEGNTIVSVKDLRVERDKDNKPVQASISLSVILGDIAVKLEKVEMQERKLEIETPGSLIGVRGTFFTVNVDRAKKTKVKVLRGRVSVKNIKTRILQKIEEVVLAAGQGTDIEPGRPPLPARNLSTQEISELNAYEGKAREEEKVIFKW